MTPATSSRWSAILSVISVVLLIGGISMIAAGRARVSPIELLGISILVLVVGVGLRAGALRGFGMTLVMLGAVSVLLVMASILFFLLFAGVAIGR